MTPPSPTTTINTTPKLSSEEEEEKKEKETIAWAENLFGRLENELAPQLHERVCDTVTKCSGEVYKNVTQQSKETAQTLQAWGQRLDKMDASVMAQEKAVKTMKEECTGLVEEAAKRATRNAKAHIHELLPDHLKTMQASVDQLRDDNKMLREELKAVQDQLRDVLALLQAQHLSNADEDEAGASPSAAPIA